tara:strand:+ start:31387 stop:31992 length:606 start_codon:yes stop_codon:yes gene_type:complete
MNIVIKIDIILKNRFNIISMEIKEPREFRDNIISKLKIKLLNNCNNNENIDDKICINLERGIYNSSLELAKKMKIIKKWDNIHFVKLYLSKLRTVYLNLNNEKLFSSLINKTILAGELGGMTHIEMRPDLWKVLLDKKRKRDEMKFSGNLTATTEDYTCRRCLQNGRKGNKCSHYQLQTRSADEPMTTYVDCLECGNRWKC